MRIVFMGTPEFSVPILESLISKYEVCLVVTQPDKEIGRKRILTPSPVKLCAIEHGIKVFQPVRIKDDYEMVVNAKPDIIITAAFGQFIPQALLDLPPLKAINVHGSLLPKYRGGSPIQTAIIKGEKETGISIMYMTLKMDAGDIIAQKAIPILDSDDNGTLFKKLSILGRDLLIDVLPSIISGNNMRIKQQEQMVTFAYNISHDEQIICWSKKSREIFNLVRGLCPNPGALTTINGVVFKIIKTEVTSYEGKEPCGTVLDLNKCLLVKTVDGAIKILTLQPAGKKQMDVISFLNGQKFIKIGDLFE